MRPLVTLIAPVCVALLGSPAWAVDLPVFAQKSVDAQSARSSDFWKGFSYGVEGYVVGGKGIRGGLGGAANVAWTKALDNNLVVSLKTSAGYMPGVAKASPWGRQGFQGANFAQVEAVVGYEIGRIKPWASIGGGGLGLTKTGGFSGGLNAVNDMFGEKSKKLGFVSYGAGVDYAVNNNLTIGVAMHGIQTQR
jgi:opacity protein-like surface antigen